MVVIPAWKWKVKNRRIKHRLLYLYVIHNRKKFQFCNTAQMEFIMPTFSSGPRWAFGADIYLSVMQLYTRHTVKCQFPPELWCITILVRWCFRPRQILKRRRGGGRQPLRSRIDSKLRTCMLQRFWSRLLYLNEDSDVSIYVRVWRKQLNDMIDRDVNIPVLCSKVLHCRFDNNRFYAGLLFRNKFQNSVAIHRSLAFSTKPFVVFSIYLRCEPFWHLPGSTISRHISRVTWRDLGTLYVVMSLIIICRNVSHYNM